GIAFSGHEPEKPAVDVQDVPDVGRAASVAQVLRDAGFKVEVQPADECRARLVKGKTALYLVAHPSQIDYVYDKARAEGVLARQWVEATLLRHELGEGKAAAKDVFVVEPGSRYIDFLLPGLVGMNIMGGGLFGVGFILVDMRVRKLFKRLMATPMHRGDFLFSMITARMLFLMPEMLALLLFGWLAFRVPMNGSLATL